MARFQKGQKPWNWRGEPIIDPRGYVLIFVGKGHPLADCRGYAYEHRLVAQMSVDRLLNTSDLVHHENEIKSSNDPGNLNLTDRHWHRVMHRKSGKERRLPGQENPIVECECRCGSRFRKYDDYGRVRRFVSGHNPPDSPFKDAIRAVLRNGLRSVGEIAAAVGVSPKRASGELSTLRKMGFVKNVGRGQWELL